MESDDWFGGFVMEDFHFPPEGTEMDLVNLVNATHSAHVVHCRHGLALEVNVIVSAILTLYPTPISLLYIQNFLIFCYGQRNMKKQAIQVEELTIEQREVYKHIRHELSNPQKRERILEFIHRTEKKKLTRRMINYFVVHFARVEQELSYYLDRTTYPHEIIGQLNEPHQPDIFEKMRQNHNIQWINFHQEYKNSKSKLGRRNRHAPYRRSIAVRGKDGYDYSLCELNFYLWLDDIGGFELFYMFEAEVREKKAEYDRQKRLQEKETRKKRKICNESSMHGKNYRTHLIQLEQVASFSVFRA